MSEISLPSSLSDRFHVIGVLSHLSRHDVFHVRDAADQELVIKVTRDIGARELELLEVLPVRAQTGALDWNPLETGVAGENSVFVVFPYHPLGSLRERLSDPEVTAANRALQCREFVEQCTAALAVLHARDEQSRQIIYGGIEPSSILVSRQADGKIRYLLSNLDSAKLLLGDEVSIRVQIDSPRYSSPEVLATNGEAGSAADFWSMGLIVLEWLTGASPFESLQSSAVRRLVVNTWQPDFDRLEALEWRALLGGLLERNPEKRWNAENVARWLNDVPETMAAGLAMRGEAYSPQSFNVRNTSVHTLRALAKALLEQWPVELLRGADLPAWLSQRIGRPDLAVALDGLMRDESLDDDLRLLHFAHGLHPTRSAVWRALPLNAEQIDVMAQIAEQGDAPALSWLTSLLSPGCALFHERQHIETARLLLSLQAEWKIFNQSWNVLIFQGMSPELRPSDGDCLPLLVRALFSDSIAKQLRDELRPSLGSKQLFQRHHWYFAFGQDVLKLTASQLVLLQLLNSFAVLPKELRHITLTQLNPRTLKNRNALSEFRGAQIHGDLTEGLIWNPKWGSPDLKKEAILISPGESHFTCSNGYFLDHWDKQKDVVLEWLRKIGKLVWGYGRARLGKSIPKTRDSQEIHTVMRLFRLEQDGVLRGNQDREIFAAHISWNAPPGMHVVLHIIGLSGLMRWRGFMSPNLPSQGSFHIPLLTNCRILITAKDPLDGARIATKPMRVWLKPMPEIKKPQLELTKLDDCKLNALSEFSATDTEINELGILETTLSPLHQTTAPSKPRRYRLRWKLLPTTHHS